MLGNACSRLLQTAAAAACRQRGRPRDGKREEPAQGGNETRNARVSLRCRTWDCALTSPTLVALLLTCMSCSGMMQTRMVAAFKPAGLRPLVPSRPCSRRAVSAVCSARKTDEDQLQTLPQKWALPLAAVIAGAHSLSVTVVGRLAVDLEPRPRHGRNIRSLRDWLSTWLRASSTFKVGRLPKLRSRSHHRHSGSESHVWRIWQGRC